MAITSVTKSEGYLVIVKDGVTYRRSIVFDDTVCSLPPTGYEEVGVIYVDHANEQLIVNYNGETLAFTAGVGGHTGAEMVDLMEALPAADRLSHNDGLSDLTAGNPHTQYVLKSLFDAGTLLYAAANDVPEAKTRAELIALLSGQAGAAFNFNDQDLNEVGHIGAGGANANPNYVLIFSETLPAIDDNSERLGVLAAITVHKTSADFTSYIAGGYFEPSIYTLNTQNWTDTVGLRGVYSKLYVLTGTAAPSTITGAANFYADAYVGPNANDMVLTNYYGLYVAARSLIGNSKLTNCYGIYLGNMAGGATLNYAIYTNAGLVHFGDNVDLTAGKTVDGRDVSADGTTLDGMESKAIMWAIVFGG